MLTIFLLALLLLPLLIAGGIYFFPLSRKKALTLHLCSQIILISLLAPLLFFLDPSKELSFFSNLFRIDALSAIYLLLLVSINFLTAFYSRTYFLSESFSSAAVTHFLSLWNLTLSAGILALISNNIALMWVALEATTIFSAFLICIQKTKANLEAMWKYLIICTIGVAFAFIGTLLILVSAENLPYPEGQILWWSTLYNSADLLQTNFLKTGFIFLLVGYGTKSAMAPMHTWMPDAYSHAPSPLGALSSGILINLALYSLMRFIPIVKIGTHFSSWAENLFLLMGLITIVIAGAFIFFQKNINRLLAYSSIEHMGITLSCIGLGAIGMPIAFYHTFNHAIAKSTAFFSVGELKKIYGSHEINDLSGLLKKTPFLAFVLTASLMALLGTPPFSVFISKMQFFNAIISTHSWATLIIFSLMSVFIFIATLRYILKMLYFPNDSKNLQETTTKGSLVLPLTVLFILAFYLPSEMKNLFEEASRILMGIKK